MRLLKWTSEDKPALTKNLLDDDEIPAYAILSHTWEEGQEVTFEDLTHGSGMNKSGYKKIRFCRDQAERDGLHYFWVDTCCINKADPIELQTAINSMFRFYQSAAKCYVYLADVSTKKRKDFSGSYKYAWEPSFRTSRWFTRGWTLQELLAPHSVKFFSQEGHLLGDRRSIEQEIHEITEIAIPALRGTSLGDFDVEERLSWTSNRRTTYKEDKAYSLLGIFGVFMPLIYGEGEDHAFKRLREEIYKLNKPSHQPTRALTSDTQDESATKGGYLSQEIDCLRSLSFPEQDQRFKQIETAKDTCQWLLDDPEYRAWTQKPRGLFWIKGNPGTGKSVLMKFAVANMIDRQVSSFFVHGQGTELQRTPLGIYRALLNSMLRHFPEYLTRLTRTFEDQEERFGTYTANRWSWSEKELQDFLSLVLTRGSKFQAIVIFIDALDECGDGVARGLFTYLRDLMEDVEKEGSLVKICVSSRHYPILSADAVAIPTIFVEQRNYKDIRSVIQKRLKDFGTDRKRNQIRELILSKAQGGFQWAVLVTALVIDKNATGMRVEKLHETVTSMPQALDELYTNILSGLTDSEERQMVKLFQWILFVERPLSTQELRDALATDKDMVCTTVSELRLHESWSDALTSFETYVKYISRGLVEFQTRDVYEYEPGREEWNREAQFIHQSVAEYIQEKWVTNDTHHHQGVSHFQAGDGHFEISRSCLRYLALKEVLDAVQLPRGLLTVRFPLVQYATRFVFEHIRKVERQKVLQLDLLTLFCWDARSESLGEIANLWTVCDPNRVYTPTGWPFVNSTTLHFLIALGSNSAFNAFLLENHGHTSKKDSNGDTPLLLAIRESQQDMALVLLGRIQDCDPNQMDEDGRTPLSLAAENGQEAVVRRLCNMSVVEFDVQDNYGRTPLIWAAGNENEAVVKLLLETGKVEVDRKDNKDGRTPLSWAAGGGNEAVVRLLLETDKVDIGNRDNRDGRTPLSWAAANGHEVIVKMVSDTGKADVDLKDNDGRTPLSLAAGNGHEAVTKMLLETGEVDVNLKDNNKQTPLLWATANGHEAVTKMLLETGEVDVNLKDDGGRTPLFWAAGNGHEAVTKMLLETGEVDVNLKDDEGRTPLSLAAGEGHEAVIKMLLETGEVDVNLKDDNEQTPLLWATANGHEAVTKMLLETGEVDVNLKDEDGKTPLLWAAADGHEAVTKMLLETGEVDVNLKDDDGRTPLSLAAANGHEEVIKMLLETGKVKVNFKEEGGRTLLLWTAAEGHEAGTKTLLKTEEINVNLKDNYGRTPLSLAAANGHEAVTKMLLETGEVNVNFEDDSGRTPFSWAAENGHEAVTKMLLETREVDVNLRDETGWTPLSWTVANGHEAVTKMLLETGEVDVNLKDNEGRTPLLWAAENGDEAVTKMLLETGGVDVNLGDNRGITPILRAAANGHEAIFKMLFDTGKVVVDLKNKYGRAQLSSR